jgi:hypothetical protein
VRRCGIRVEGRWRRRYIRGPRHPEGPRSPVDDRAHRRHDIDTEGNDRRLAWRHDASDAIRTWLGYRQCHHCLPWIPLRSCTASSDESADNVAPDTAAADDRSGADDGAGHPAHDDGTYGRCETCGVPINDVELAAGPLVRECTPCSAGALAFEDA